MEDSKELIKEWISVDERLPRKGKAVLACRGKRKPSIVKLHSKRLGWFSLGEQTAYTFGCFTHWMPLPEPPKV